MVKTLGVFTVLCVLLACKSRSVGQCALLVSRGQTAFSRHGAYRLNYKRLLLIISACSKKQALIIQSISAVPRKSGLTTRD